MEKTKDSGISKSREEEIKFRVVCSFLEDLFGVCKDVLEPFGDILQLMESPGFAKFMRSEVKKYGQSGKTGHSSQKYRLSEKD